MDYPAFLEVMKHVRHGCKLKTRSSAGGNIMIKIETGLFAFVKKRIETDIKTWNEIKLAIVDRKKSNA